MVQQYIPASELDFNRYKESLKEFLKSQDRFKDYDFEGSNLNILLELLTYNTYNVAHFGNMVGSEAGFIDTAQLRESIVSHAKSLNYTPRSRTSARAVIDIEIVPTNSPAAITVPRNYVFRASTGDTSVKFMTDREYIINRDSNGRYLLNDVTIYEGELVTERFIVAPTTVENGYTLYDQIFDLKSANVDTSSISVSVYPTASSPTFTRKAYAESLYGLDNESDIYFVRGYKDNYYSIEFGDGILGAAVYNLNMVEVTYRDTIGEDGNGTFIFARTTPIDGHSVINVTTHGRAYGGSERESNESIKYNAPRYFQVQERATTDQDYELIVKRNFPQIYDVQTYSGDIVSQYGKVFIVLKPVSVEGIVDNATKNQIVELLKTKNIVPEPIIQDPDYYYLRIDGEFFYNGNRTTLQKDDIKTIVYNNILELNDDSLAGFNTRVDQDTILQKIKKGSSAIEGGSVDLNIVKRWVPILGTANEYNFTTDNAIEKPEVYGFSTNVYSVISSVFQYVMNDEIIDVVIQDDGAGNLVLCKIESNGTKTKIPSYIGTVDYDTGAISFFIEVYDYDNYVTFDIKCKEKFIQMSLNKWISVDSPYINVEPKKF